jgi:hypothetical protein
MRVAAAGASIFEKGLPIMSIALIGNRRPKSPLRISRRKSPLRCVAITTDLRVSGSVTDLTSAVWSRGIRGPQVCCIADLDETAPCFSHKETQPCVCCYIAALSSAARILACNPSLLCPSSSAFLSSSEAFAR